MSPGPSSELQEVLPQLSLGTQSPGVLPYFASVLIHGNCSCLTLNLLHLHFFNPCDENNHKYRNLHSSVLSATAAGGVPFIF